MADFSFTPAAAGIRPIPQTSLSDMLNVARGAQQYQQAQQINPLELQRAQTELQRIQALTPLEIGRATAELGTAQTGQKRVATELEPIEQANTERKLLIQYTQNPENFTNADGTINLDKAREVFKFAPQTGSVFVERITGLHKLQTEATKAKSDLNADSRTKLGRFLLALGQNGESDPKVIMQQLDGLVKDNPELKGVVDNYSKTLPLLQPGQHITDTLIDTGRSLVPSAENGYEFQTINGVLNRVDRFKNSVQPVTESTRKQPTAPTSAQPIKQGQPQVGVSPEDMFGPPPIVTLSYPKTNTAGGFTTQQTTALAEGRNIVKDAAAGAKSAQQGIETIRKIREKIGSASGSALGQYARDAAKSVIGNESLDELAKNIATLHLQAQESAGANTDSAKANVAIANGSTNISPEALKEIINRADADFHSTSDYNKGLQKFIEKYGKGDFGLMNARDFVNKWQSLYDQRIWKNIALQRSNLTREEKIAESKKNSMSKADIEKLNALKDQYKILTERGY